MSLTEIEMEGTIQPDGTLVLDEKTKLMPGRVKVVLRQEQLPSSKEELFRMMEEIWAGQKARGFVPRTVEEVETERRKLRDEVEEEIEEAIRLQQESRRLREQAEKNKETTS